MNMAFWVSMLKKRKEQFDEKTIMDYYCIDDFDPIFKLLNFTESIQ